MSESANGAVVVAHDVTRRYGEGDTAVDALRGVSVIPEDDGEPFDRRMTRATVHP